MTHILPLYTRAVAEITEKGNDPVPMVQFAVNGVGVIVGVSVGV